MASEGFLGLKASLGVFVSVLAWQQNSLHDHMHGDWCPSASAVSGRLVEPGEEAAHKSQSIFCYSAWILFQATPVKKCVHGHCTHNLLVLRSTQFSVRLGPQSSCGHKSLLAICVFLAYKQSVGVRGMNDPPE